MDKKNYTELMAKIAEGGKVSRKTHDELTEFAKSRKLKRPPADAVVDTAAVKEAATSVKGTPAEKKAPKAAKAKAKCDPASVGSSEKCSRDSRSNGLCATHYSRLVYRAKPENAQKAREASKAYAAKQRAAKKAAAAESGAA